MLCKKPIYVDNTGGIVPCGQCRFCRIKKRREKTARCALEARNNYADALFVHLTYKNDFLPVVLFNEVTGEVNYAHETGCLDKPAVQKFFKRLLRRFPPRSIRYFYCGEYGDDRERPHYHMVIWGVAWKKRHIIHECWTDTHTGELQCAPERLRIELPKSDHDVANYCCGYLMKARTNEKNDSVREWLDGRPPEFFHSSKGLGLAAVEGFVNALKDRDDIPREFLLNGKSYPIDRYLKEKILDALPHGQQIREKRQAEYKKEMQALFGRAKPDAALAKLLGFSVSEHEYAQALQKQFVSEKAVEMDLKNKRLDFFERTTK